MTKQILYNDVKLSYNIYGDGKPIILIHGFGETGNVWKYQVNYLQNYFKLIVPDLPGSGKSECLNIDVDKTSIGDFAECIHSILAKENINNCIVLGHSMGGYITLSFAEKFPGMLSAFGFVHSTAFADSEEKKQSRKKGIEMIEQYGSYSFLKNTTPNLFGKEFKKQRSGEIEGLIEDGKQFTKKALQQYYYAMMTRSDKTAVLKNANVPVLFIAGSEDVAAPLQDVLKQVHLSKITYFHLLEKTGHMGMWEASNLVNKQIEDFVNEVV